MKTGQLVIFTYREEDHFGTIKETSSGKLLLVLTGRNEARVVHRNAVISVMDSPYSSAKK